MTTQSVKVVVNGVVEVAEFDLLDLSGEIITEGEALRRVGLGELAPDETEFRHYVEWKGYPVPFSCGHITIRGFGPVDRESENNNRGAGRRYQQKVRVSQHICSGHVLFCWSGVTLSRRHDGTRYAFRNTRRMAVSVDVTPDGNDTCLKIVHPC